MELPPLSPGIQARVMEEVEVVDTVRRGWSGGTEGQTHSVNHSVTPVLMMSFYKAVVYNIHFQKEQQVYKSGSLAVECLLSCSYLVPGG